MARILGNSDAWQQIVNGIAKDVPNASTPADLHAAIRASEDESASWLEKSTAEIQAMLVRLECEVENQKVAALKAYEARKVLHATQAAQISGKLRRIQRAFFLIRWYYHIVGEQKYLREWLYNLETDAVHAADDANARRRRAEQMHAEIAADTIAAAARLVSEWTARLDRLRAVVKSKEWSGASVELEVIDELAQLPDDYVVLSGVELWLQRAVRYGGGYLKTAQVDHAVVEPTGIFIVETKAWSREFAGSGQGFNPFDQVGRARHLCKCVLNDALSSRLSPRPYGCIAYTGCLPPKPAGSLISAMYPSQLRGFILRDWGNTLTQEQANLVASEIESFVPRTHPRGRAC